MQLPRPYLAPPRPRAFAHRGWHIDELAGLENSLAAFQRAADEGYLHLETDVQVTADGVVVVQHDATLDRTTDRDGTVGSLPWAEVRKAKIGGREPISRLEDLLEELPDARFNIDVKADAAVEPFIRVIERTGSIDRVAAASFSSRRLGRIRALGGPGLALGMGPLATSVIWMQARAPSLPLGSLIRGHMAQVPLRYRGRRLVTAAFVHAAHRVGVEVHVWTVDDAAEMHTLLDMGVDGIITDRPDILRDVLTERQHWPVD